MPIVFVSCAQADDDYEKKRLTQFGYMLEKSLRFIVGHHIEVFQMSRINVGQNMRIQTLDSLKKAAVFVPIITPTYLNDDQCQEELSLFLAQERQRGRNDLIIPIYYQHTKTLEDIRAGSSTNLTTKHITSAHELAFRLSLNWQPLRYKDLGDDEVRHVMETMAHRIHDILQEVGSGVSGFSVEPTTILPSQYRWLLKIISDVALPDENLWRLYHSSVYVPLEVPQQQTYSLLVNLIVHLSQISKQKLAPFPYPILEFVERLSSHTRANTRMQLQEWSDAVAEYLGVTPDLVSLRESFRTDETKTTTSLKEYLLVDIEPDEYDETMFRVNAWTWKGPKHAPCVSPDADWKTAEEIEQVFRELYHVLLDQNDFKLMGSTIEFFLPRELMHWNVENWEVRLWKTPSSKDSEKTTLYKLGRTHPVVIRWRDRYRYQDYHNLLYRWQERWKALITTGNADYTRCVLKVPCQDKYSKTTIEEVKQELLSNEDVGFTILMAPPYLDDPTEPEILKPILELGTPIVLWIKQTHHPAEWLQKELYGLLPQSLIVDLPLAVKQRRVSAKRDDETDIGHHLSLLWDDPDRLPPIPSDLTPPSRA